MSLFVWPEASRDFVSLTDASQVSGSPGDYYLFRGAEILMRFDENDQFEPVPDDDPLVDKLDQEKTLYLGELAGRHVFASEISNTGIEDETLGLRALFGRIDRLTFNVASRAVQVLNWHQSHLFCGRCGGRNIPHESDRAMVCRDCRLHVYPRLSPSIIVLVHREDEVLLARNHRFPEGMYSTLAGFVEPGETIEQTVHREVFEEVGLQVSPPQFMGSQSWPFPDSLMLGFHADYAGGDIVCQEDEIADAQWFPLGDLPAIPGKMAISRWLIDSYLSLRGIPIQDS